MCAVAGSVGTLATNTVSQGDTREVGLDRLTGSNWTIHRAVKSEPWPNEASLEIAKVWLWAGQWPGARILNSEPVPTRITPALERASRVSGVPRRLSANGGTSFIGSVVNGMGFVLSPSEAAHMLESDPRNQDVVKPYLNGADLNDDPCQLPSRYVIDFQTWPVDRAREFSACFERVERLVRPARATSKRDRYRDVWWQFSEPCLNLYRAIDGLSRVLAIALTSKTVMPAFESPAQVFAHATAVFAYNDDGHFGVLSSAFHWWWAVTYASTMRTDLRYTPSDVFETFPQPEPQSGPRWERIDTAGRVLNEFRADLMIRTDLGLTKTYNRVHDPDEQHPDLVRLRELHVELDYAVRDAYGWSDLELDHHHWETPQGVRFTVSPVAKDKLLDLLLELNQQRYAEEVATGLHDKKTKKAVGKRAKASMGQRSML
jgi:hypothetical protein